MRVFVTGASGYIGSAVSRELIEAGHRVVGLARSDASAALLDAARIEVHRGELSDLDSLTKAASDADGVIHLAFQNITPTTDYVAASREDFKAVTAMGAALEGSNKPLVSTSGTLALSFLGRVGTETDTLDPSIPRIGSENAVIAMAERGVRSSVVRLSPSVHGNGDLHGFVPSLIGIARASGVSGYVGSGENCWPGVHRLDAARLYRLALERAPAGSRLHGAGEPGVAFKSIAEAIGRQLQIPVTSVLPDQASEHFSFLAMFVSMDNPISNELTKQLLSWSPIGPTLLDDIDQGFYFNQ